MFVDQGKAFELFMAILFHILGKLRPLKLQKDICMYLSKEMNEKVFCDTQYLIIGYFILIFTFSKVST